MFALGTAIKRLQNTQIDITYKEKHLGIIVPRSDCRAEYVCFGSLHKLASTELARGMLSAHVFCRDMIRDPHCFRGKCWEGLQRVRWRRGAC
jgi:hypothetical protein